MNATQNVSQQLFLSTLSDLLKLHAPHATLLAPVDGQVFRITAAAPALPLPGNDLTPPDEWMDHGEMRWLSQGGALLGLLWSQEALPDTAGALLNLLLRSASSGHSEQDSGLMLTHLPAPVAWLDGDLRFRQVSRHFLNLHGLQQRDVLGRRVDDVFPTRAQLVHQLGRALAGQAVTLPLEQVAVRGERALWLRGEARPYFDAQGIGVLWTSQDASEERGLAQQLDSLLDDSGVMMAVLDPQGQVQNASSALMALGSAGGQAQNTLLGAAFWDWPSWPPESRERLRALVAQAATGEAASAEVCTARGNVLQISVHGDVQGAGPEDPSAGTGMLIAECHDLSALRELQEQAAMQRSLISEILARSSEATVIVNSGGKVTLANEEAANLLGIEGSRLTGAGLGRLIRDLGVQLYDSDMTLLDYSDWARETMPTDQELVLVNAAGVQRTVRLGVSLLPSLEGQRPGLMLTMRDVTAMRRMEARLRHDTLHDALTGLLNRNGLRSRLQSLGPDAHVSLLALDISGFSALTAALGRIASDALLVHLAARLVDWRPNLLAARLNSNVFVLGVTGQSDKDTLEGSLRELQHHLRTPLRLSGRDLPLNFHVGATGGLVGRDADALLGQAETALSYVKHERQGADRQGVGAVYQEAMRAEVARDFRLESELPGALSQGQLRLTYQPLVSLNPVEGPVVVAAEALLRWHHPELGVLAPPVFLPLAARSALISDIGEWVVGQALAARTQWQAAHPGLRVSVNLSLDELLRQDNLERLFPLMEEHGPPDFELSAGSLIDYSERTLGLLERLHALGARILVDDFGDGASSLTSLERFPISGIKLHPSFVARLQNPRAFKLLEATTTLARSLALSVTAVGVETREQLALLRQAGVGAAQGYIFAAPMAADALDTFRAPDLD
ncbi:sensor domain-containing protein [Deinococcus aquiradiocola]|uniref:GGDEF domain-containing protein n=1 Tax=Deinococcus aquiradiocola TaxID=393059 RepID=A0A917UQ44_9DEIO|nr:EAL domain-containing protein [Deinococcus aquiradiocola]GGJ74468.1 GGDEF domain-containing protein [Deinococcus aquiradiocola]